MNRLDCEICKKTKSFPEAFDCNECQKPVLFESNLDFVECPVCGKDSVECYKCKSEFKDVLVPDRLNPFDHHTAELYELPE